MGIPTRKDDENAYQEDEEDDEDDFAKKVGVMFSRRLYLMFLFEQMKRGWRQTC